MTVTAPAAPSSLRPRHLFVALIVLLLSRPGDVEGQSPPSSSSTVPDSSSSSTITTTAQILTRDVIPALTGALDAGDLVECYALTRFARLKVPPPPAPPPPPPSDGDGGGGGGGGDGENGGGDDRTRRRAAAKAEESWHRLTGTEGTNATAPTPDATPPTPTSSSGSGPILVRKSALGFRYKPGRHGASSAPAAGEGSAKPPFELTLEYGPQRTGADMDHEAMPQVSGGGLGAEGEEEGMFVSWQNEGKIYYESKIDPSRWETATYMAPITGAVMSKILENFVVEYTIHHPRYQPFEVYDVGTDRALIRSSSSDDFVWHLFERLASLYVNLSPILPPARRKIRLYVNSSDVVAHHAEGEGEGGVTGSSSGGGAKAKVAEKVDAAIAGRDAAVFMDRFYRCGYAVKNGESTEEEDEEVVEDDVADGGGAEDEVDAGMGTGQAAVAAGGGRNGTHADDESTPSPPPSASSAANATSSNATVAGGNVDGGDDVGGLPPAGTTAPRRNSTDGVSPPPPPDAVAGAVVPPKDEGGSDAAANKTSTAGRPDGVGDGRDSDIPDDPVGGDDNGGSSSFDGGVGGNGTGVAGGHDDGPTGAGGGDGGRRLTSFQTASPLLGGDIASALSPCLSSKRFFTNDSVAYLFLDGANFYRLRLYPPYLEALTLHETLPEPQRLSEGQGDFVDWTLALLIIGGIVFGMYMILLQLGAVRPRSTAAGDGGRCPGWLPGLGGFGGLGMVNANGEASSSSRHSAGGGISLSRFGEGAPHSWGEDAIPLSMGGRAPPAGAAWHAHQMRRHDDLKGGIAKGIPPSDAPTLGERREVGVEGGPNRRRDPGGTERGENENVGTSSGDVALMPVRNGLHSLPGSGRTSPVIDFPGGVGGDLRKIRADSLGHLSDHGRVSVGGGSLHSRSSTPDNEDEIMIRHMQLHMQRNHRDLVALPDLTTGSRVAVPVSIADRPGAGGGGGGKSQSATIRNGGRVVGNNDEFIEHNTNRSVGRIYTPQGQGINT